MQSNRTTTAARFVGLAVAAGASTLTGQAALAQGAAAGEVLQEVVVTTARQREEALQDVPASITAITSDTLEAAAVSRAADFVRLTPGVSLVQTAEVADSQVNIRGINGARDAENSFALIIDGVLQTNPAAFNREYSDLKQIEVVKGPQGAIYGRNAAAGAIIVTTTRPSGEFTGDVELGFAEDNTQTANFTLSGPISDRAGWKLQGDYRSTDGFYQNRAATLVAPQYKTPGLEVDSVDDFEGWNVNARFVFEPTDASTLDIKAHYGEVDAASISFNAAFALPVVATAFGSPKFYEDPNQHEFFFDNGVDPFNTQDALDVSVKFDTDVGVGRLTAWALYSDIENAFGADGTSGAFGFFNNDPACLASAASTFNSMYPWPPPQFQASPDPRVPGATVFGPYTPTQCDGTQYQERNQTDYSFEVRLASNSDGRLDWLAGFYYLNIEREVGVNTGIDDNQGRITRSLYVPRGQPNGTEALVWDEFNSDVYAGFASLNYDVTDELEVGLAVRYDREKREARSLVPVAARTKYIDINGPVGGYTGNAPLNPGLFPGIGNPAGIPPGEKTFSQFQPKVTFTWEPAPEWTWFANWGVGFKSGGFNNSGSAATADVYINSITGVGEPGGRSVIIRDFFDEETSSAAEIGFKSNLLDRRLQLEAAVYNTKVDDMQFFEFLVGAFGLLRVVNNIDEVELTGFELAATFAVTDEFRLSAGYSRIDSEIQKNTSRPKTVGNKSPYTPDYTVNFGAEIDVPVTDTWRMQASAFYNLVGPTWFHTIQEETNLTLFAASFGNVLGRADYSQMQRDKYDTIDVRVAAVGERWSVALVGKNVTDEKFLQEVIVAPEFGGAFIHPSAERRVGVEVGYRF
jgi:iron complex outermembrane receptor protein